MIRIVARHFVAGVVLNERDMVVKAAPIVKYMIGWHSAGVMGYCRRKGWKYEYKRAMEF